MRYSTLLALMLFLVAAQALAASPLLRLTPLAEMGHQQLPPPSDNPGKLSADHEIGRAHV